MPQFSTKRRVKTYTLTASGRAQLAEEKRNWKNVFTAMNRVLGKKYFNNIFVECAAPDSIAWIGP